jgi:hypothetical protein
MTTTQILLWFTRNDNSILVNPNMFKVKFALLTHEEKLELLESLVLKDLQKWP